MMDSTGLVRRYDERGGRWVRLVLHAPRGNLLSLAMVCALGDTLDAAFRRPGLQWLTLEGAASEFSWGADIAEHRPDAMRTVLPATHHVVRQLLGAPVPTAALVRGRCLGGGFELALCCDDILAASDAMFGCPEVKVGAFPPIAALLLPPRVGASRASRAIVTGDQQGAEYWHDAGLVSLVPPEGDLYLAAREWFDSRLAPKSAVALAHASRASRLLLRTQVEPLIDQVERQYLDELLPTHDATEGVDAFLQKRRPEWRDR
jgi:cyclohexa-1,5-dienecarbonyl-CoA hydratase